MMAALLGMSKFNLCLFLYSVVEDTYHTVVYKELSAFKWIDQASTVSDVNNLKWILKVDDDVLLNVGKLKQFLDTIQDIDSIYCQVKPDDPPLWDKTIPWNKW